MLHFHRSSSARTFFSAMLTACLLATGTASAGSLEGNADTVHKDFNQAAKDIDVDVRMVLTDCGEATCTYSVTGKLGVIASKRDDTENDLESLVLIFGKGSDANNMILSMGILMIVYSPDAERDERGSALTQLSTAITGSEEDPTVILGDTKYTLSNLGAMGLWFQIEQR